MKRMGVIIVCTYGRTNRWTDRWMEKQVDGRLDRAVAGWTARRVDLQGPICDHI